VEVSNWGSMFKVFALVHFTVLPSGAFVATRAVSAKQMFVEHAMLGKSNQGNQVDTSGQKQRVF
jgi:hypothetical protein